MKKWMTLLLTLLLALSLTACGGNTNGTGSTGSDGGDTKEEAEGLALGEKAATDIVELTLDRADLAVALGNTQDETYYLPKEYSAEDDSDNPFVAAKGHTLVAMTYTLANLDRASVDLDGSFNPGFLSIGYNGESYSGETHYGYEKEAGGSWEIYSSMNVLLSAGETASYRCYVDIPVEAADLNDTFTVTFTLPNSQGESEDFTYAVTAEDRAAAEEAAAQAQAEEDAAAQAEQEARLEEIDPALSAEISQQLQGEWQYTSGPVAYTVTFDGDYCYVSATAGGQTVTNEGPFSVRKEVILIEYTMGDHPVTMPYTYENGELSIYPIETE